MNIITKITASFSVIITFILNLFGISGKAEDFRVTSYIVADTITCSESLHSEDFDIITDVILFGCATFDTEGIVHINDEVMNHSLSILRETIGNRNVRIFINLLGPSAVSEHDAWEDYIRDLSVEHDKAFESGALEDNVVCLVNDFGFDGVFFDYEYPADLKEWSKFSKFLVSIDKKLGNKILGIAASTDVRLSPKALKAVDRVEAMLYDIFDKADGKHSSYELSKSLIIHFTSRGIDKDKLDFGLPFYSRPTDKAGYWYEYATYADRLDENGWYYDDELGKDFWFNTPDVIARKTKYALDRGLGGVMIWNYSCDLPSSDEKSLLRAIGETIDNYSGLC